MIKRNKVLAVIQARGGSKGIPKKNIYPINGFPLISYTIYAALKSKYIDELIISTDSKEIKKISEKFGAMVPFLRPKNLATDKIPSVDSLHHAVKNYEKISKCKFDYIVELPCVSPFRTSLDIDNALEKLFLTNADSVISVCNTGEKHPVRLKRINNDQIKDFCKEFPEPKVGSRRQDLENCYIRNGAIYSMKRDVLINKFSRHGDDSRPFIMPSERSINIDEKLDLLVAELLIKNGNCENYPSKIPNKNIKLKFSKNKNILISTPIDHINQKYIDPLIQKANFVDPNLSKSELAKVLKNTEYWICQPSPQFKIDKSLLKEANHLKVISSPSTGLTHIDTQYCQERSIKVKGISNNPKFKKIMASSEYTFSLILSLVRNIIKSSNKVKSGLWREVESQLRSNQLFEKNIGIIGLGRIGKNIARYSRSFGMNVLYYDPSVNNNKYKKYYNLYKMLNESDVVLLSANFNKNNILMINDKEFKEMKKGCFFINTSRGEMICEKALLKYLGNGKIKAAALDVITNEQNIDFNNNKLIKYSKENDNLIITPHIAGLTTESENLAFGIACDNLI